MAVQDKDKEEAKKFQKSYFDVLGLCCSTEVTLVENILMPLEGVKEVSVIVPSKTVIVVHDSLLISQIEIVKALNQERLQANVRLYGAANNYKKKWPSPYAIASGVLLLLSFLKYAYRPLGWLALGAVVVGIFPIAMKGLAAIRNLRLDINILAIVAVIGTIALKDYTEAGTIVFLFTVAEWLESRAGYRAKAMMLSLMSVAPQKAVLAETGEVVDVDEVKLNTTVAVKAGEVIPIDGIVVEGKGEVDEKTLTGESYPVAKEKDSTVWAGTINLNGYISVKTTALAEDCAVAKMTKLVEEAQNSKTRTQRFIDKCAKIYTPAVLVISVSVAVVPAALHVHNLSKWFHLSLVVLVSACPCALILSTPVVTFCTLTKAATSGLLIKGGDYIEILAKVKIIAFDKTGTITSGEFVVIDFQSLRDDISLNTLLYWVASIERKSSHPMADALIDYGRLHSVEPKPENVEEFQNFPGEGIHGKIDGQDIYIGNRKIALRANCETVPTIEGGKGGKTIGYIYVGGTPAGIFTISDTCRSGAAEACRELKKLGIKTAMLTGDSHAAALQTNEQLKQALEAVHAELLPEDKARIITEFKTEGITAMVGDGINDAPALATADIGISMGISGSALAQETGNIVLLSNDIRKVPKAVKLARRANRKVIQNVVFSITIKGGILALGFAGHPLVWAAVLADVGTCVLVILNSMLLLKETQKHGGKSGKNSSAPDARKLGSNAHCDSRKNQHCCSDSKAIKACKTQKCSQKCGSEYQPSCSDIKAIKACKTQKCSSQKCGSECLPSCSDIKAIKTCKTQKCSSQKCGSECQPSCSDIKAIKACKTQNCSSQKCGSECQPSCSDIKAIKACKTQKCSQKCGSECQPSCSDIKAIKACKTQKCSSQKCGSECQPSPLNSSLPGNHKHNDDLHEARHCDGASHMKQNHDLESQNQHHHGWSSPHNLSSCAEDDCTDSVGSHGNCAEGDKIHEEKHCKHSNLLQENQKPIGNSCCHSTLCGKEHSRNEGDGLHEVNSSNRSAFPLEVRQKSASTAHCDSSHCCKEPGTEQGHGLHEAKQCNHSNLLEENQKPISNSCCHSTLCGKEHSRNEGDGFHEVNSRNRSAFPLEVSQKSASTAHCDSSHCGKEHGTKRGRGLHEAKHCNPSTFPLEESKNLASFGHCHPTHCGKDHIGNEALGKLDGTSCDHQHHHHNLDEKTPPHTTIDIVPGNDHKESSPTHSCISSGTREEEACCSKSVTIHACVLENREVGGCCKSYMEECCGGQGHIGPSLKGCLSEITTE